MVGYRWFLEMWCRGSIVFGKKLAKKKKNIYKTVSFSGGGAFLGEEKSFVLFVYGGVVVCVSM